MSDEPTQAVPPSVSHTTLMSQIDRLRDEGIPTKIDKHFLSGMAGGTQYQFRHALRSLDFITEDDRPTPLLERFAKAERPERSLMFGAIMREHFPELMALPDNASKSDLLGVLQGYGVTSPDQQRKMLAFYAASADYAGVTVSPHIRPTKARTGPRKPRTTRARKKASPTAQDDQAAVVTPPVPKTPEQIQAEMQVQYFDLLLKSATEGTKLDKDVLDRIERLVGQQPVGEEENRGWNRRVQTASNHPASQEEG